MTLNVFGCPRTSKESHIDTRSCEKEDPSHHTCGLFLKASFINHSCYSNVRRSFIGDMMIVRATRNLPAGSELFFWYSSPEHKDSHAQAQTKFQNWGFNCTCVICGEKKVVKKSVLSKRYALLEDLKAAFDSRDLAKAERLLTAAEKTYSTPAVEVPRLALWDPYLLLARMYSAEKQPGKTIQAIGNFFDSLGFVITRSDSQDKKAQLEVVQWGFMNDHVVEAWILLWAAFTNVKALDMAQKALENAKLAYRICVGDDSTFDKVYGKFMRVIVVGGFELGPAFSRLGLD